MDAELYKKVRELLDEALSLPPGARAALLDRACANDTPLRREIESLLAHEGDAASIADVVRDAAENVGVVDARRAAEAATTGPCAGAAGVTRPAIRGRVHAQATGVGETSHLVGRTISHFRIESRLGTGGMGEVYLAEDRALGRLVALKVLKPGFSRAVRERLLREAWASARLQHPGIATFYEAGEADGVDFIAMEYMPGETLRERLRRGPLPVEEALSIVAGLLEALAHAHFCGILHRDIKPANIMFAEDGAAKLLDLGLAKGLLMQSDEGSAATQHDVSSGTAAKRSEQPAHAHDRRDSFIAEMDTVAAFAGGANNEGGELAGIENLTQTGATMGTPGFMAPEQLLGVRVDEHADLFAVGAVLYEMLAGRPAFPGRSAEERLDSILRRDPDPIENIPPQLNAIVTRTLEKDASRRMPSASAMLREIRGLVTRPAAGSLTLAALEFSNLTDDEESSWLTSALPESFGASLARIDGLTLSPAPKVAAATRACAEDGATRPTDIGLRLGCSLILSGSVKPEGASLTVTVTVTEVATGFRHFDEPRRGSLAEILDQADQVATTLAATLDRPIPKSKTQTREAEAYECYARGRRLVFGVDRGVFEEARRLLERAVAIEPDHAQALSSLGFLYGLAYNYTSDPAQLETAKAYASRAIEVDPLWADGYLARTYASLKDADRDFAIGCRDGLRAFELDPSNYMAPYMCGAMLCVGRLRTETLQLVEVFDGPADCDEPHTWLRQEGVRLLQRSVELNPAFASAWWALGMSHVELSSFAEAQYCLQRAVQLEPTAVPATAGIVGFLGECERRSGNLPEARARFLEALDSLERTDYMYRDTFRAIFLCGLGKTALAQGDVDAGGAAFKQAVLHLRGRPGTRGGGHVLVQALAGRARAGAGAKYLDEAVDLLEQREGHDFTSLFCATLDYDLLEIARAAQALGREEVASEMLARALDAGSVEAMSEAKDVSS